MRGALLCAAVALAPAAAAAAPVEVDGRVSLRGIYSADAPNNPQTFLSFLETDARASGLTDGDLRLVLDATFILDVTETNERRFGETERLDQIRNLYVELPGLGGRVDLRVGRRIIPEAGNAWVDGVEARFWVDPERASVGAYGGLAPDPFDRAFGTTFQAAGLYGTLHRPGLTTSAAYNTVLRDAEVDRQFVFHRLHWKVADGLFLSTYLVFDFVDVPEVTTLLGTVDYTPVRALNLTLTTSRYSIEQYRDQTVYRNIIEPNQALLLGNEVVDLVYNRVRFSGSLRVYSSGFHYQSVEYKQRSQDGREAWLYTIGIRDEDVLGTGVRADLQGQVANEFQSDTALVALDLRRDVGAAWTLGGRLGWFDGRTIGRATERGRAFDEAQRILLIGAQVAWRASASHHVDVIYDGAGETELQDQRNGQNLFIHTAMARYSWLY
ncbi:MAG: hypothetical protein H6706_21920 [Myxococcales bacterium]|nr:hypothetical protein [Myxococcales bacterium]